MAGSAVEGKISSSGTGHGSGGAVKSEASINLYMFRAVPILDLQRMPKYGPAYPDNRGRLWYFSATGIGKIFPHLKAMEPAGNGLTTQAVPYPAVSLFSCVDDLAEMKKHSVGERGRYSYMFYRTHVRGDITKER